MSKQILSNAGKNIIFLLCIMVASVHTSTGQMTLEKATFDARFLKGSAPMVANTSRPVRPFGKRLNPMMSCQHMDPMSCSHGPSEEFFDGIEFQSTDEWQASMMTTNEELPAGTLIIAMDNALQDNSATRVRQAYGLAVRLLHAEIPLKWIINPNKTTRTGIDFSASARLRYPTTGTYANRDFRTGPIAIFPGFEAEAQAIINSFGNGIRVYELQNATTVPVETNLTHKPFVFVEVDQNPQIHTSILSAAGLTSGTHYQTGDLTTITGSSCVTIITVPHNSSITTSMRDAVKAFVRSGGNFFAQCAAVRGFQATAPRVFTNAGFRDEPGLGTFAYDNPTEPSAQFEGNIVDEGGSLEDFGFTTEPPGGTRIVHGTGSQVNNYKAYTGRIDGVTASAGGYVHYFGGHDHGGNIHADRYYLNAVLRSAERPTECGLNLGPIAQDDTGTIDCGNNVVTINVLDNDTNPLGGALTVNLLGTGSNGTFVNNNDGTVTYTGDVNGLWAGDQVNYEACAGSVCSEATITITSTNPNLLVINGTVFEDLNTNGLLDNGENGPSGVTVNLYDDLNVNGVKDGGEPLLQSTSTNAGGGYSFTDNSISPPTVVNITNSVVINDSWQNSSGTNFPSAFEETGDIIRYKGYRWTNLNIPANAVITNATVTVTGFSGGGINVAIRAENLNAPPNYTSTTNYLSTRAVTTNSVNWSVPSLSDNVNYTTPDFSSVVQQVVDNNSGLTHLSVIFSGTTGTWVTWNLDDGVSSKYQRLNLTYTIPGDPANFVIEVDASTLPAGSAFTTDNVEVAQFTALGEIDCKNNFGFEIQNPSISMVKSATPQTYNTVGQPITYNFLVTNTGNVTLTNVNVSDPLPGLSSVSPASVTLAPGASQTFTATYNITQANLNTGSVQNTATASGTPPTGPAVTAQDSETITAVQSPAITIVKSASPTTYNTVGQTITYSFLVTNTGNVTLTNVGVTDPLPGLSSVNPAPVTLAPGANQTFTATYSITQADLNTGSVQNTATASGTPPTGPAVTAQDSETITAVQSPAITIVKSASPTTYSTVGQTITYSFLVTNTGNVTLTNVSVTDPLPGLSSVSPAPVTLAPGANQTFTATYSITQADLNTGSVQNTATASGTPPTGPAVTAQDSETITAVQTPGIQLVKTNTNNPQRYSYVGDILTYDLVVTNTGNVTLNNVVVSDPVATVSGSPIASLAPNASVTVTAQYVVTQANLEAGSFTNTASAIGNYTDVNGNPQTVTDTDDATVPAVLPDVTPIITAIPNVMQGLTEFNLTVRVTELNDIATNGLITVRIPKDVRLSFSQPYDSGLTMLGSTPLNNSVWSFSEDANYYIFSTTSVIGAGGFSTFGFVAEFDPGNSKGVYTLTSQIDSGSGGETRIDNNVDSEKIDYFIN